MTEPSNGNKKASELAEIILKLHQRFGKPNYVSFLDGSLRIGWSTTETSLAGHEEISVDTELLYYSGGPPGSSGQIYFNFDGDELVIQSAWSKIWPRIYDLAGSGKGP